MLQTLSDGELHIGMGRGTAKSEYDAFGIGMETARDRFRETWEFTRKALQGGPVTHAGHYANWTTPTVLRPALQGRMPNFYGAIGSLESAAIMADLGLPPLCLSTFPDKLLRRILETWKDAQRRRRPPDRRHLPHLHQMLRRRDGRGGRGPGAGIPAEILRPAGRALPVRPRPLGQYPGLRAVQPHVRQPAAALATPPTWAATWRRTWSARRRRWRGGCGRSSISASTTWSSATPPMACRGRCGTRRSGCSLRR